MYHFQWVVERDLRQVQERFIFLFVLLNPRSGISIQKVNYVAEEVSCLLHWQIPSDSIHCNMPDKKSANESPLPFVVLHLSLYMLERMYCIL